MLFIKECRKILFSLTFVIYFVAVIAMYFTQFQNDCNETISKPSPNQEEYGMTAKEIPEILMPAATEKLVADYLSDSYIAYPIGFYKNVHLSKKKKQEMADIITEISGITKQELDSFENYEEGTFTIGEGGVPQYIEPEIPEVNIPDTLTYERFRELMNEADKIIGGGSDYSDENLIGNFSLVPKTYEDVLAEYEMFINDDKITNSYARLYCDYMGIVLAILPVFVAVSLSALDRKSRMEQLAYSRKISSVRIIFTRFAALMVTMIIPVIITAVIANVTVNKLYPDNTKDNSAFLKYAVIWLIPNIMSATAVGMFVTEITSSMLAIFVQGVWWFTSIFAGSGSLTGNIGKFTFLLRHNSLYDRNVFMNCHDDFIFNRVFFAIAALAGVMFTASVYEMKRRGVYNGLSFSIRMPSHKSET